MNRSKKMIVIGGTLGVLALTSSSPVAQADTPLDPVLCPVVGVVGLDGVLCGASSPVPDLPTLPLPLPSLPTPSIPDLPVDVPLPGGGLPALPSLPDLVPSLPSLPNVQLPSLPNLQLPNLPIELPLGQPGGTTPTLPSLPGLGTSGTEATAGGGGTVAVTTPVGSVDATASGHTDAGASCTPPAAGGSSSTSASAAVSTGGATSVAPASGSGGDDDGGLALPEAAGIVALVLAVGKKVLAPVLGTVTGLLR